MQRLNVIVGMQRVIVGMLSKNFQANHQLDVDLWTEFPCMFWRQDVIFNDK
jgi:hypothetical protein